ncbi:MAG: glycosyltransferase [Ignavibacteria bacterium]|nr:MAG: glycosyltransferase [Ignavibacteria bacterium]
MAGLGNTAAVSLSENFIADLPHRASAPANKGIGATSLRPCVKGKFIFIGGEKFYVKGVAYGTFRPDAKGEEFHDREITERDLAQISACGLNTVRTYTVPPAWFFEAASRHTLLDDPRHATAIEQTVRASIRSCSQHPAILCFAIGNEIPAPIVRWHSRRTLERFIRRLYHAAKSEDPGALVTYVNYPSTEYLQLEFLDLIAFNVYLESQQQFASYLQRLQNIAGERPLLMAEVGLDSRRNGEEVQARMLEWQVRTAFAAGCAGTIVFGWTDEWHRGGHDIMNWDFGLTHRNRSVKPSLKAVSNFLTEVPLFLNGHSPHISVIICAYNEASTIRETLEACLRLEYSNFEIIVVNDGSTDETAAFAAQYGVKVISTENRGLSHARNIGLEASAGEIVAYIDADAYPDPHWLTYLASTFLGTCHAGVGGPNLAPRSDGPIAECIANAPGGPTHVLLSDEEAEHIPGCNMAFRRECLQAIGGFDTRFRTAGDDVDVCWRIRERGWTLGFSPGATVWHHRRKSVRAYWKQQRGYGKAEGMLERKWPEKYNRMGHVEWSGRLYGNGHARSLFMKQWRVYHGVWGSAPFQFGYYPSAGVGPSWPLMPEWYLVILALAFFSGLGVLWKPMFAFAPFLASALGIQLIQAARGAAARASLTGDPVSPLRIRTMMCVLIFLLRLLQPLARLLGRLQIGLTPLRRRTIKGFEFPKARIFSIWRESWKCADETLKLLESKLAALGAVVGRGDDYARWDLEVRMGMTGAVRLLMTIEEHGSGRQLVRFRTRPFITRRRFAVTLFLELISAGALLDGAWDVSALVGATALALALTAYLDCANAASATLRAIRSLEEP